MLFQRITHLNIETVDSIFARGYTLATKTSIATIAFEKVEKKIKRDIYEKAKMTDYKYFDNPEFYDNYTWTINERVQKANEARSMIVSFFTIRGFVGV